MSGWCVWTVQQEGVECGVHRAVSDYLAILAGVEQATCTAQAQSLAAIQVSWQPFSMKIFRRI